MDRQYTPEFYYTISPDFNYREYLEKRSHFDRVVISLDDQTAAIVGGGQQLAQRISGAANTISGQIAASGLAIESQLSDIERELEEASHAIISVSDHSQVVPAHLLIGTVAARLGPRRLTIVEVTGERILKPAAETIAR